MAPGWVTEAGDGLVVRVVAEGSAAAAAGLRAGDRIVRAKGEAVGTRDELAALLEAARASGSCTLQLVRGGASKSLAMKVP